MTKEELIEAYKKNTEEFIELARIAVKYQNNSNRTFDNFLDYESNIKELKKTKAKSEILYAKLLPLLD